MAGNPPALALGSSAPNAMVYVVGHGVFEARLFDWAVCAYSPRYLHAHSIAWEERVRRYFPALPPPHPRSVHHPIVTCSAPYCYAIREIRSKP
jgi:hypothetical protein